MNQFNATETQIRDVNKLYEHLLNRSSLLNRSRPQSVDMDLFVIIYEEESRLFD